MTVSLDSGVNVVIIHKNVLRLREAISNADRCLYQTIQKCITKIRPRQAEREALYAKAGSRVCKVQL